MYWLVSKKTALRIYTFRYLIIYIAMMQISSDEVCVSGTPETNKKQCSDITKN